MGTNLSNAQQAGLQNAVQLATMDMTNLSNAQQKAVLNAQSFLKMDMTNLTNAQQTEARFESCVKKKTIIELFSKRNTHAILI